MIDARKFNDLKEEEKATLVLQYCKFVTYTDLKHHRVQLYILEDQFVEVWYDFINKQITQIRIPTYEQLNLHVKDITIKR